jgi:hypothetical protein
VALGLTAGASVELSAGVAMGLMPGDSAGLSDGVPMGLIAGSSGVAMADAQPTIRASANAIRLIRT